VASQFGLVYLPEAGSFTHDLRTALMGAGWKTDYCLGSSVWTPDEVENRVAESIQQKPVLAAAHDKQPEATKLIHRAASLRRLKEALTVQICGRSP